MGKTMKLELIKSAIIKSWWVIAFILIGSALYEKAIQKRESQFIQLQEQLAFLQEEKLIAINRHQNLQLQTNSQSDLAWIELALMKGLGVTPEDQQKVYFFPRLKNIQ